MMIWFRAQAVSVAPCLPVHAVFLDLPLLARRRRCHTRPMLPRQRGNGRAMVRGYASSLGIEFQAEHGWCLACDDWDVKHNDLLRARPRVLDRGGFAR